jgi:hypothetical protein
MKVSWLRYDGQPIGDTFLNVEALPGDAVQLRAIKPV